MEFFRAFMADAHYVLMNADVYDSPKDKSEFVGCFTKVDTSVLYLIGVFKH